jgi:outer membrane DcaP-like protein
MIKQNLHSQRFVWILAAMILLVRMPPVLAQTPPAPSNDPAQEQSASAAPTDPAQAQPTCVPAPCPPPPQPASEPRLEIYGYVMTDFGYDINQINPDWFDVMRPSKLPSFHDEFGRNGRTFAGVRQTRNGIKGYIPTKYGELKTTFEWELFGVGVDTGQTTFRLRHAYGELGHWGAGQTWSPFMDPDIFPNSLEYWGPNGMVFFRNVQVRWMPLQGDTSVTVALERPGSSQDPGLLANRIEISNAFGRFQFPDVTGDIKTSHSWGYLRAAGIYGNTRIDDLRDDAVNLDQLVNRWGVDLTSNIKTGKKSVIKLGWVIGEGVENYMNDAPVDIGPAPNFGNPVKPILAKPLPFKSLVAFWDVYWSDRWSSTIGYSQLAVANTPLQLPAEFKRGQYALTNLLWYPDENVMLGGEFQWGRRANFSDGFRVNDYKVQFSFKFSYSAKIPR